MLGRITKEKHNKVEITISNPTVIRVLGLVIVSFLFLAALRKVGAALVLIFVAFFLALALNAPVHWIADHLPGKRRGSRTLATGVSFLLVVVVLGGFLASIVPPLVRETRSFFEAVPGLVANVRDEDSSLGSLIGRYDLQDDIDKMSDQLSERLGRLSGTAVSTLSRVGGGIVSTLTVLVLTFMMLAEGPMWAARFKRLIPHERRKHTEELASAMYRVVKGYVNGQVVLAVTAALILLPPFFALHVSYPIALMVVVFICGLIPLVGHTIGAVIVSFVALFTSPLAAIIILVYYILYQQIENYFVQPHIQANATNMSPLLVFASVIIGVSFGGLLGGLLAIPIAGCLRILILDYLHRRHMLDEQESSTA
jgi:predicted PurR-regulated permease PerM